MIISKKKQKKQKKSNSDEGYEFYSEKIVKMLINN